MRFFFDLFFVKYRNNKNTLKSNQKNFSYSVLIFVVIFSILYYQMHANFIVDNIYI